MNYPLTFVLPMTKTYKDGLQKRGKSQKRSLFLRSRVCINIYPKCTRFYRALVMFSPYLSHISNSFVFYRLTKCNADIVRRHGQLCSNCVPLTLSSHSISTGMLFFPPSWWWDATVPSKFDMGCQILTVVKF